MTGKSQRQLWKFYREQQVSQHNTVQSSSVSSCPIWTELSVFIYTTIYSWMKKIYDFKLMVMVPWCIANDSWSFGFCFHCSLQLCGNPSVWSVGLHLAQTLLYMCGISCQLLSISIKSLKWILNTAVQQLLAWLVVLLTFSRSYMYIITSAC